MSWEEVSLKEVCTKVTDGTHDSPKSKKSGFPFIKGKHITSGYINFDECEFLSEQDHLKVVARSNPEYGDTLFSNIGSNLGSSAFVNVRFDFSIKNVALLKPDSKKIFDKFLFLALRNPSVLTDLKNRKSGSAQPFISLQTLRGFKIPVPPLPTQKKIASILSTYDDLIENNLKRIQLLEEAAQRIYKEWFVDFKFPNHENTTINHETGLPDGWEKVCLIEVANLIMGQSPKSIYYNTDSNGLPFHQGVSNYGFRYVENKTFCTKETRIAEEGDILFSVRAPVGRLNIAPEKLIIGRGLSALRSKTNNQSFLFYQLKHVFFQEDMIGGGAIFNSVTKKDLETFELIEPSTNVIIKFEGIAKSIDKQIKSLTFQNQNQKEARDLLLPRLMNRTIEI